MTLQRKYPHVYKLWQLRYYTMLHEWDPKTAAIIATRDIHNLVTGLLRKNYA